MNEIILPILEESTGGSVSVPPGFKSYVIPEGMSTEDKIKLQQGFLQNIVSKEMELDSRLNEHTKKVEDYKNELEKERSRNIEIIGLFSSVLALLIVDVSIIKSVESFLAAILLVISLTCSIAIFAVLIHVLFTPTDKVKFRWSFWLPVGLLVALLIFGIVTFIMRKDLYKIKSDESVIAPQIHDSAIDTPPLVAPGQKVK